MAWKKCPSVTTGGKAYFWTRECVESRIYHRVWIVWNRDVRAYAVTVERRVFHGGQETLEYVSTPQAGRKFADSREVTR